MPANAAKRLSRIRGLKETLSFPPETKPAKMAAPPFRAPRIRSVSLLRTRVYDWGEFSRIDEVDEDGFDENGGAASKQRRRWSLKEFLYRSISEGRGRREKEIERERLVRADKKKKKKKPSSNKVEDFDSKKLGCCRAAVSKKLSPAAISKETAAPPRSAPQAASKVQRRRVVSAHERYYSANRAQAEELKKKTFLPYRQGLLGFFGSVSKLEL